MTNIPTESITIDGEMHEVESANYSNIHPNRTCVYCHMKSNSKKLPSAIIDTIYQEKAKQHTGYSPDRHGDLQRRLDHLQTSIESIVAYLDDV